MKSTIKALYYFFNPKSSIHDPLQQIFFFYDIATTNLRRLIKFSLVLSIVSIILLIWDLFRFLDGSMDEISKLLSISHLLFLIYCLITFITSKVILKKLKEPKIFRIYFILNVLFLFSILIWMTLLDQLANGQITVILMGYFGISALLYLYPIDSLILYSLSSTLLFYLLPYFQKNDQILLAHFVNIPILSFISFLVSQFFFQSKVKDFLKNIKLEEANSELDELIHKVLPVQVSYKLRKQTTIEPVLSRNVTIGFIDIVSFSTIMENTSIDVVLNILDELFREFDVIIKKHNLEKIKTIGDSYMFAGGLFSDKNQTKEMIEASFEIIELIEKKQTDLQKRTNFKWSVRIGIDKGDVISGIIGNWRFVFDVWGNTVNIAARLETLSLPQRIHISKNVYEEVKNFSEYTFETRGVIPIKNISSIETFFVFKRK
ncbi:MAG: adenylate/guanylate cyclase domain-containing protein [Leptospiraceae bacterium]|nr:adenylate/guanylate cyclase domain-containing protein [Leptospiraceae bacterium]MDW7976229.1 adenylate/guanylate cyclase domain-containing protein [Leptospiraceae bacterium]